MIRFRPELFWDVDPKTLDPKKHARYIIERILDFGEIKELQWLVYQYPQSTIQSVIHEPRNVIDKKSKALWQAVFQS